MTTVAVLDDWQGVAKSSTDWSALTAFIRENTNSGGSSRLKECIGDEALIKTGGAPEKASLHNRWMLQRMRQAAEAELTLPAEVPKPSRRAV